MNAKDHFDRDYCLKSKLDYGLRDQDKKKTCKIFSNLFELTQQLFHFVKYRKELQKKYDLGLDKLQTDFLLYTSMQ